MRFSSNSALAALLLSAGAIVALPALGQDAPESLLPEGFGDPVAPPPPPPPGEETAPPPVVRPPSLFPTDPGEEAEDELGEDEEEVPAFLLSTTPLIPLTDTGPLTPEQGGLGPAAFGDADGVVLERLMRRLDAPLPSRWASILLRRALLSRVPAPRGVSAPDWIAERAWLLLRMGEADSARLLVQQVDPRQYSPKLYDVAMQTALANGDPASLCPIVEGASQVHRATGWILARGMCASLAGEPGTAAAAIEQARRTRLAGRTTIDTLLAEKVAGAGLNTRRSITIEWDGVEQLTAWRFGLASATAVEIPGALFGTVGAHVGAWRAQAPFLPDAERIAAAKRAAALGVFSSAALVDLYGGLLERTDASELGDSPAAPLRDAYAAATVEARMEALRTLWDAGEDTDAFANLILTARAAARVPVDEQWLGETPRLISAMLTAGLDTRAAAWSELVEGGSEEESWALLALASPRPAVTIDAARAQRFADANEGAKGALLLAGLAGLGRLGPGEDLGRETQWSRLLERAVGNRQPGTVALLAAIGLQTPEWRHVPPAHLYRIVSALRRVGLEPEARMIAAEAVART